MKRCQSFWILLALACLCLPLWAAQGEESRDPGNPLDQGGETCAQAVAITTIPYCDNGTTAGHVNDYPVPCNTGSAAPDVVYFMTPPTSAVLSFSLCGSAYNSALTIWRGCPSQGGVLVCCSDNVCGDDACCSGVQVQANVTYFIVVDGGLAPNSGNYTLNVVQGETCPNTACNNCPYPNLDVEPNNSCTSPTTTVTCGDTICGFMEPGANDYYIFSVPGPGSQNITIDVFGNDTPGFYPFGQGLNPSIEVQTCTATFGSDADGGVGGDARLDSLCLPAGTYLIRVAAQPQTNSGPYIVAIHCTPCQSVCPFPSRDTEPTNDNCSANIPNITCGDTLCGDLSTTADRDWYRLSFTQFPCVDVHIAVYGDDTPGHFPFGQGLNPKVSIYADDCTTLIAQDSDGGTGLDALLDSLCLRAGTYNVLVESEGAPGPYELWVWCTGCDCPSCLYPNQDIEPNQVCAGGGGVIACGDTVCGDMEVGSNDYYYFQVPGPGCKNVTIDVFGDDTPGFFPFGLGLNPVVQIISTDCATTYALDGNSGAGEDARIDSLCLPPGNYRMRVGPQPQATNSGPYIIATSCTPCQCPDTCDYPNRDNEGVNNTCGTFNPPTLCGDTLCGELTSPNDNVDWYLLTVVGPGLTRVKLDVFGDDTPGFYPFGLGLDPMVRLVGVGCTSILGVDTASGVGEDASLEICVPQGSYNIQVQAEDFTHGPYILGITCTPCDTCPYPSLDIEPLNDNCGTQNPLIHCNDALCGEITQDHGINDDWYLLQITQCTQLFIDILGDDTPGFYPFGRGLNTAAELWRADCNQMLYQDLNSGAGEDAQLNTPCLEPGFYMLRVFGEGLTEGPYILFIGCESCTCTPPCDVVCPEFGIQEIEPCPAVVDTFNGGCDGDGFTRLFCGDVHCARSYNLPQRVDSDWYRMLLTESRQVRVCVDSEFDGLLSLYARGPERPDCQSYDLIECMLISQCGGYQCLSVCLPPGIYDVSYRPQNNAAFFECRDYVLAAACSDCQPTRCEAPDSVVIHFPDTIGVGNALEDIVLYWPPVPGVSEYRIYRTSDPVGVFIPSPLTYVATTNDTFFVHEDIIPLGNPVEEYIYYVLGYCRHDFPPCDVVPTVVMPPAPDIITPRK